MTKLFDAQAIKKPASISINSDLLVKARKLNRNLSATLEEAIIEQLKQKQRKHWRKQNAKAIQVYNRFVNEQGVFSDKLRRF